MNVEVSISLPVFLYFIAVFRVFKERRVKRSKFQTVARPRVCALSASTVLKASCLLIYVIISKLYIYIIIEFI